MLVRGATLAAPFLPLPLPTMHPASSLSATTADGNFQLRRRRQQQELGGAASSPSSPSRGTRAGGESGGIRCQDRRHRNRAYRARRRCPAHVKTSHVPSSQCGEPQQMPAVSASSAAVESIRKRPRPSSLPSVATTTTTASSVDQPIATVRAERFAREVSLDALFRRVQLGPGAEVAYYTTITVAGHVFRGVLYDVGPHSRSTAASDTDRSGEGSSLSTAGGSCLDLTLRL